MLVLLGMLYSELAMGWPLLALVALAEPKYPI